MPGAEGAEVPDRDAQARAAVAEDADRDEPLLVVAGGEEDRLQARLEPADGRQDEVRREEDVRPDGAALEIGPLGEEGRVDLREGEGPGLHLGLRGEPAFRRLGAAVHPDLHRLRTPTLVWLVPFRIA